MNSVRTPTHTSANYYTNLGDANTYPWQKTTKIINPLLLPVFKGEVTSFKDDRCSGHKPEQNVAPIK